MKYFNVQNVLLAVLALILVSCSQAETKADKVVNGSDDKENPEAWVEVSPLGCFIVPVQSSSPERAVQEGEKKFPLVKVSKLLSGNEKSQAGLVGMVIGSDAKNLVSFQGTQFQGEIEVQIEKKNQQISFAIGNLSQNYQLVTCVNYGDKPLSYKGSWKTFNRLSTFYVGEVRKTK